MPLHKTSRTLQPTLLTLLKELVGEWKNPRTGKTAEPDIFEADPGGKEPIRLYVVWSKWKDIAATDRSDVILDAFEAVRGKDMVIRVAVATGFTPDEARSFGLEGYEDDSEG